MKGTLAFKWSSRGSKFFTVELPSTRLEARIAGILEELKMVNVLVWFRLGLVDSFVNIEFCP